ncbi:ATP-dependent Clp protease proteolytic subunit [Mongoliimonas terrestris]|uniref:ATP-dependent Clp protease proteolytic subunit n=1 Tax=Mongoliimonas terrestris TaxID=1709001 RepID=UPI00094971B7|nr:ATP-dependent Clp protease proteolytic subunit [Mongoliimonas terrestris]
MTKAIATEWLARLDDEDEKEEKKDAAPAPQVDKYLFKSRTVLITGGINQDLAKDVTARLLALAEASHTDPITVIVSSPGGHVESGDMIHDMIQFVPAPVNILGTGWVASAGALIYVSVPKERRFCTPNTRFLLHQPSGGTGGMATDIEIQAREILKMRDRLNKIFSVATGQPLERIEKDTDRDYWMSADEAIAYGLAGRVVRSAGEITG